VLLVGGTMLYFKALTEGLSALPRADPAVRARIDARAAREGWPALHASLAEVDPVTAQRLHPADAQRVQRALEVFELTGKPLSVLQGARDAGSALGPAVPIAVVPSDRAGLHATIAERFDAMLAAGLVDELHSLRARYALTPELPSMRCVGYRQAWEFLDGRIDQSALRASLNTVRQAISLYRVQHNEAYPGPTWPDVVAQLTTQTDVNGATAGILRVLYERIYLA
jgi:tRNA dimethylallyltransferase